MTTLPERVWYGTAHARAGLIRVQHFPLLAVASVLALVVIRLLLPITPHPSMGVYEDVVWALMNQENWGRQALVAVLEYPPLPLVALLMATVFAKILPVTGSELLVAVCQVWTITYLVRIAGLYSSRKLRFLLGPLFFAAMVFHTDIFAANPFWVHTVLLSSIFFHLCRLERDNSLRDLVVVAFNCGILIFTGIHGMLFSLVILLTLWLRGRLAIIRHEGGLTLLMLPASYALVLYPLFNWLIMGDGLFWLRRWLGSFNRGRFLDNFRYVQPHDQYLVLILVVCCTIVFLLPSVPLYLRVGFNLVAAAGLCAVLRQGADIYLGGETLMLSFLLLPGCWFFLYAGDSRIQGVLSTMGLMAVSILFIGAAFMFRLEARGTERFRELPEPPASTEILELVDQYWERSRVLIYDLRTASIYAREHPNRFWARLDFDENYLNKQREDEQFHLLIPPNNGKYYSQASSPLASIHQHRRRWLFLEKEWPGGWQLYRCIRPPQTPVEQAP